MDPNANLKQQLELAAEIIRLSEADEDASNEAFDLAELVEALNAWITSGGFLPEAWRS